ncbi:hypothetical protein FGE12_23535 [Aggregicoccus sp. 17bor-14]|uniref:hypothetical protein n=1 Tax=Myxococcaceae TaxID=31 RepID=UPI00129C2862|nr:MULTISPECIES: hypothetical protein [Myxococcaceae]MRI91140.1 hypothetical protein [Aggregicoccus sp. 17bor-14]
MQFTLVDDVSPSLLELLLGWWAFLLIPVGLPLLLWLRHSARNPRDVLLGGTGLRAGTRRGRDGSSSLVPAGALIGLQLFGMLLSVGLLRLFLESDVPGGEDTGWLVAPTLAGGLMLVAWMLCERSPRAARDVLHVERVSRRRE